MSTPSLVHFEDITAPDVFPLVRPTIHHNMPKMTVGYSLEVNTTWRSFRIPAGFNYDGASIPQIFWTVTGGPYHPRHMKAALVHDWIYLTRLLTKHEADAILKDLLLEAGRHTWLANGFEMALGTPIGNWNYKRSESDVDYLRFLKEMVESRGEDPNKYRIHEALAA